MASFTMGGAPNVTIRSEVNSSKCSYSSASLGEGERGTLVKACSGGFTMVTLLCKHRLAGEYELTSIQV